MSDFKAKMYQIQFRLGLRPRPRWGSLQRSPRLPSWIKGPTSKGRGRDGMRRGRERDRDGERTERGGGGREGRERGGEGRDTTLHAPLNPYFWIRPCYWPIQAIYYSSLQANSTRQVKYVDLYSASSRSPYNALPLPRTSALSLR